ATRRIFRIGIGRRSSVPYVPRGAQHDVRIEDSHPACCVPGVPERIRILAIAMKSRPVPASSLPGLRMARQCGNVNVCRGWIPRVVEHPHLGRALVIPHGEPIGGYADAMPHFRLWTIQVTDQRVALHLRASGIDDAVGYIPVR